MINGVRVEVRRGGIVESVHAVDVAVARADRVLAAGGDGHGVVFARSATKPFQTTPLVAAGAVEQFGLTEAELAVCCASHGGERGHVELVGSILRKIGLEEGALACGAHAPYDEASARALRSEGRVPARIHNNCSGKHAGMMALARSRGWDPDGYHRPGHPVQRRMLEELARWTELEPDDIGMATDGCGVVAYALPLSALAGAFARLVAAPDGTPGARVAQAMAAHPWVVAGTGRLCTRLMEVTGGRILAKVGAEGVYAAASRSGVLGIALKVRDGAKRAAEVALLGVLGSLGLLEPDERSALEAWARPAIGNTLGETVGVIEAVVELERIDG